MNLEFYLFDVNHGQSAAIKLPDGRWCIFDAGASSELSPTDFIRQRVDSVRMSSLLGLPLFRYYKATISHLHGDHLTDYEKVLSAAPSFLRTVDYDVEYVRNAMDSSSTESGKLISGFWERLSSGFSPALIQANYGMARIYELSLPVKVARALGGSPNSKVNNASVVSRIECYGNVILVCGDVEIDAWDLVLQNPALFPGWQALVSNVDVLIAPHHGHSSSYSTALMQLAKPKVVLVSVESGDEYVDSRYSSEAVSGITVDGNTYKRITTRDSGTIHFSVQVPKLGMTKGIREWHSLPVASCQKPALSALFPSPYLNSLARLPVWNPPAKF